MDIKHEVARSLLSIEAVFLRPQEPFTWASGIKSPIYCDNRLILTAPEARDLVERAIAETVKREYPQAQVLMGTATAGIAHAAIAAHLLGLPMGYVRSSSKDHGRQNRIEGKLVPGQKVVVVEDLISTGGSVLDAVDALREAGAEVLGVVSIFTYGMKKGVERLAAAQVRNVSLTDLDTVARTGAQEGYITDIEAGIGLHKFDRDGIVHRLIDRRCERAAGFRPRADADDLVSEPLRVGALHDQGAVEVLAALRLQAEAARFQDRQDLIDHGFCRLGRRTLADLLPHDLARGAADHDLLAGRERGNVQQFKQRSAGGFADLFIHEWSSPDSY